MAILLENRHCFETSQRPRSATVMPERSWCLQSSNSLICLGNMGVLDRVEKGTNVLESMRQPVRLNTVMKLHDKRRILKVVMVRLNPLSAISPRSSACTRSSARMRNRCETRIWPGCASAHSRAARLVTVPMTP